jgi:hypothetical protein
MRKIEVKSIIEINGMQVTTVEVDDKLFEIPANGPETDAELSARVHQQLRNALAQKTRTGSAFGKLVEFSLEFASWEMRITPSPPRLAEFLFSLFASKKTVDAQLGDLQEVFDHNVERYGVARARMRYWSQVLRAVGPNVWRLIRKWGLIGILIDYGRSKLGL